MKSIVIIGPAFPYRGGIAATNELLAKELSQNAYDVQIITFTLQYPQFLFPGKTQYSESLPPETLEINRAINTVNPLNWFGIGRKLKKIRPDLIIVRYWMPFFAPSLGTIARIVRKNKHTKVIGLTDNVIPHEKRIGDHTLNSYFINSMDGFLSLSKSVLKEIETFDKKKPKVYSPHPIFNNYGSIISREKALQNLKLGQEFKYVLFFGLIREYKGLDLLLEAFGNKKLEELKVKLIVAGEFYGEQKKYHDLIDKYHIRDQVILYPNFIPDNEVADYFCASDIIAQPYKSASQSGITQIGFHFEKPMLVTNVGGLSEIIQHKKSGYVTEVNPQKIGESLVDFFENNKETEYKKVIQKDKLKYSWDKLVSKIEELYSNL